MIRTEDVSGVSGTGVVADGWQTRTGQVVIEWRGTHPSIEIHRNMEEFLLTHGHQGRTTILWDK